MKKTRLAALAVVPALAALCLSSCQKSDLKPESPMSTISANDHNLKKPVYDAGIRSNQGYPTTGTTDRAYYRLYYNTSLGQQPIVNYSFGGDAGSTTRCYTASAATEIFVYKLAGYNMIDYNGSDNFIMNGANYFSYAIEEIEQDPATGDVYALCRVGNAMQVWRIDVFTGAATQITYGTTNAFFYNPLGNGYKSGSLAFVPNGSGGSYLVLTTESTVYASLGIVSWYFTITGTSASVVSSLSKNYTGLPTSGSVGTGINTTYGDGKLYFARDGGDVYSLTTTGTGASTYTNEGFSVTNAYDFGYWKNF